MLASDVFSVPALQSERPEKKRAPRCLGVFFIGDEIPPSYVGIIYNNYTLVN